MREHTRNAVSRDICLHDKERDGKEMIIKETVAEESGYDFVGAVSLAEIKTVGGSVADSRRPV